MLVEKPLTLRYCQAVELVDLARERQRLLIVGLQRRYEGFCRVFRRLRQVGALGSIQLIHGLFAHRFTPNILRGWRTSAAEAGAGVIDDSALHLVDLLTYFSGSRILGLRANVLTGAGVAIPHSFACIMETENGATLSASGSYLAPANSVQEEISIYGSCGSLFARRFCMQWDTNPPTVCYKSSGGTVLEEFDLSGLPSGKTLPLLAMIDVLQGRAGLETLHTEASQTSETHRVIEMIRGMATIRDKMGHCLHDSFTFPFRPGSPST